MLNSLAFLLQFVLSFINVLYANRSFLLSMLALKPLCFNYCSFIINLYTWSYFVLFNFFSLDFIARSFKKAYFLLKLICFFLNFIHYPYVCSIFKAYSDKVLSSWETYFQYFSFVSTQISLSGPTLDGYNVVHFLLFSFKCLTVFCVNNLLIHELCRMVHF